MDRRKALTDCISRQQAIEAIESVDWYHINSKGKLVNGSTSDEESWYKAEDIYEALESLKPITPPGKVVAEIKVDTEELVERIKEEYQLERAGNWIKATGVAPPEFAGRYVCSNCGHYALMDMPYSNRQELSHFCPNCGARMKEVSGGK